MSTFLLILITGVGLGALYFLVASGLSLIYGLMGVLNFAHGAFLTIGAFINQSGVGKNWASKPNQPPSSAVTTKETPTVTSA